MKKSILMVAVFFCMALVSRGEDSDLMQMWKTGLNPFRLKGFISPDVCGNCHTDIHEMWKGSMHSTAFDDLLFRAATKRFVADTANQGELDDAEHCVACHNPVAYRSGQIQGSSDSYDKTDSVTRNAIFCDMCHSINEVILLMNASFNTDPGRNEDDPGVKRGPRDDSEPVYHEAVYSGLHTSAEICGTCHNVTHLWYMTKLEGTYDEWYNSPYNSPDPEKRVVCQDCHMRQAPGKPSTGMTERPDYPGKSAEMGRERPHIYRHSVVGGNVFMTELLGNTEKAALARERLMHAAELEIMVPESKGALDGFTVRVKNEGAGHMLPTGVTEFRQMWLEVTVLDKKGRTVFFSGMAEDGSIPENTCLFNTVFGDSEGNPTIDVVKASRMLYDHRISPKGYHDETYGLKKPCKKPLTIRAELRYRSMDPSVVKLLLGEQSKDVPVISMAVTERPVK
ncbi:cytochrome c family protein [bacterium]|nr:cytochrome c family protein [bacterium]